MQIFTEVLEYTYEKDLRSGQLHLTAFFLKETNPAEPIEFSIKARTILITHRHYYMHKDINVERRFLLGEFLLDQSPGGNLPVDAKAVHEHAFHFCVKRLVKGAVARVLIGNTISGDDKPS